MSLVVIRTDENNQPIDPNKASKALVECAVHIKKSLPAKEAIFRGRRQNYFKGKRAVDVLMQHPRYSSDRKVAVDTISELMENNFFFRVHKQPRRTLEIDSNQYFEEDAYYIWQWESPWARFKSQLLSFLLIAGVLMVIMFPLWPMQLRLGVWYLSMAGIGFIGFLLVTAIVRLIIYVLTIIIPQTRPGIWLFPNLFADVGFFDSFIPVWGWHGVDYERMHLEKYRKKSGGRRRNKTSENQRSAAAPSAAGKEKLSDDDEEIQELEAD